MPNVDRLDGRLARSAQTRHAVVDALLELIDEGDLQPTAARIADRAGISRRLVFHHFDDLEAIFNEVSERQMERLRPLINPVSAALPLARRIEKFCAQRGRLLETLSPMRRAATLMEPFRPTVAKRLKRARELMRAATISVFGNELSGLPAAEMRLRIGGIDMATSWSAWEQMRRHQGLSENEAGAVMAATIRAVLTTNKTKNKSQNGSSS